MIKVNYFGLFKQISQGNFDMKDSSASVDLAIQFMRSVYIFQGIFYCIFCIKTFVSYISVGSRTQRQDKRVVMPIFFFSSNLN